MLVHVTDDADVLERECRGLLSWPNGDDDIPRTTTQLGKSGKVLEVDKSDNLVLLSNGVGDVPISALREFGSPAPEWLKHLEDHGYVVLKNIATPEEVETARQMIWDTFEDKYKVQRDKVSTWTKLGGSTGPGIFTTHGVMQSPGPWFIRGLPRAKEAFAQIWGTDNLITSMDAMMVWKPWWANPDESLKGAPWWANPWYPNTEWLHLDQSPYTMPELDCVQGMMPLYDVTEEVGGLEVVPGSHRIEAKQELKRCFGSDPWDGENWCPFTDAIDKYQHVPLNTPGRLLLAEAGDLILWDSRTVHGGVVGKGRPAELDDCGNPCLARLTVNFCMTPTSIASPEVLQFRRNAFLEGRCLNHCPHKPDMDMHAGTPDPSWQPNFELNESQRSLLPWDLPQECSD
jgi:ectoine hydroxylase-related dioxygenase (phytanoyl-CoA dioxygenase family)